MVLTQHDKREDRALLASIGDGIVAVDRVGRILFSNKVFEKMTGIPASRLKGRPIGDSYAVFDNNNQKLSFEERPLGIILSGKYRSSKPIKFTDLHHFREKDNKRVDVTAVITPIIHRGQVTGAVVVLYDVTEEKNIDRAKTEFLSFAAHQLRTPLSTISLTTDLMLSDSQDKCSQYFKKNLKDIMIDVQVMSRTIDSFLNISRIEMGILSIDPKPIDVADALREQIKIVMPQIKSKKINFQFENKLKKQTVDLDQKIFGAAIDNLMSNAIKYVPDKGKIEMKLSRTGSAILISLANSGPSILGEEKKRIFEKMFRTKYGSEKQGTGLGLYIAKSMIEQAGGKIWVKSPFYKKVGAAFYISIPLSGMKRKNQIRLSGGK